jgi:hypothetical protein
MMFVAVVTFVIGIWTGYRLAMQRKLRYIRHQGGLPRGTQAMIMRCWLAVALLSVSSLALAQVPTEYDLQIYDSSAPPAPVGPTYTFGAAAVDCTVPDPGPTTVTPVNPTTMVWEQPAVSAPGFVCAMNVRAHLDTLPGGVGYHGRLTARNAEGEATSLASMPPFDEMRPPAAPMGLRPLP